MKSVALKVIFSFKWIIVFTELQQHDTNTNLQMLYDEKTNVIEDISNLKSPHEVKYSEKRLEDTEKLGKLSEKLQKLNEKENLEMLAEEKIKFCASVATECIKLKKEDAVCGLRPEGNGFRTRSFTSTCELLTYNCQNNDTDAYLIVKLEFCHSSATNNTDGQGSKPESTQRCHEFDCTFPTNTTEVCAIRTDGQGFRVKRFLNSCEMLKHNCIFNDTYEIDADYLCKGLEYPKQVENPKFIQNKNVHREFGKKKAFNETFVIVDGSMFNTNGNINDTVDNFFAATHLFDVPVTEVSKDLFDGETRRRLIKIAGPVVVYTPPVVLPKEIKETYEYVPTLGSCYHKCPEKCPETYTPVCGVPGLSAREPSAVFLNHCYMDAAQCRMNYHRNSSTSATSHYTESTFVFCMGDTMNALYRFLPVLRTLQHMGRLSKKGYYRYKIRNMRFYNELLTRNPKFFG